MRTLVIDDTKLGRALVGGILKGFGVETREAQNGSEGLRELEIDGPFDLAIVDWRMPVLDGLEFVRAARKDSRNDGMKILMVTVEADVSNIIKALNAGADEYAVKPVSREVLREKLAAAGFGGALKPVS